MRKRDREQEKRDEEKRKRHRDIRKRQRNIRKRERDIRKRGGSGSATLVVRKEVVDPLDGHTPGPPDRLQSLLNRKINSNVMFFIKFTFETL